jgi:universal stress protein E
MRDLKSVFVLLDKPKHSQAALEKALSVQVATGAHLHLVAFCWHPMCEQREVFDAHQRRVMKKEILRVREEWLWELVRDHKLNAADITVEVTWTRDIAASVAAAVVERGDSLVVKSVHRSNSFLHTPLDWQLLHQSPAPVLLVNTPAKTSKSTRAPSRKMQGKHVLASVDLRHNDRKHRTLNLRVLDAAARFAQINGGKIHCIAVIEYSEILSDLDFINARRVRADMVAKTQDLLAAMLEPYEIAKSRIHRPAGKVGQMVAATARKTNAGLVVVGSAAAGHGLLGSSAEKILDRAPCDLLVVHP